MQHPPGLYRASGRRSEKESEKESERVNERKGRSETEGVKRDEKREIGGMKGTDDCGFAGGFGCHGCASLGSGDAAPAFMLLVHKFSVNGARMSRRPPFRAPTHPRRRRDFPEVFGCRFSFFLLLRPGGRRDPPLCEIARLFTRVSPGARVTREEISKFIGRSRISHLLSVSLSLSVLHRRLVPMFSRKKARRAIPAFYKSSRSPRRLCIVGRTDRARRLRAL